MNVLLVDDHTLVRKGLAQLLPMVLPGAQVTEASDAAEAVSALGQRSFDVALIDVRLPGRNGLELMRDLRERWPRMPVIIITGYDSPEYVRAALMGGAAGYLLKDSDPADLARAISAALSGAGSVVSAAAMRRLVSDESTADEPSANPRRSPEGLTPREVEVLAALADGSTNRDMSRVLLISERTVKAHLVTMFRKLGVSNRTEAAMRAVSMGIGEIPSRGGGFARRLK